METAAEQQASHGVQLENATEAMGSLKQRKDPRGTNDSWHPPEVAVE